MSRKPTFKKKNCSLSASADKMFWCKLRSVIWLHYIAFLSLAALRRHKLTGDTSVMTYRGHGVLHTLIRCRFSPEFSTGQRFIYSGCSTGKIISESVCVCEYRQLITCLQEVKPVQLFVSVQSMTCWRAQWCPDFQATTRAWGMSLGTRMRTTSSAALWVLLMVLPVIINITLNLQTSCFFKL